MRIILRILINMVALWLADWLVDGLTISDDLLTFLMVAVVFGLVNAFIKPIVKILSCPITILTLGLFTLVINALMLMLTGWLTDWLAGEGLNVDNFWAALMAAIIISIVSTVLSWFLPDPE